MHKMEELKEMLCEELDKITKKGELTASSLDVIDKLTHSIKSIETIMAMRGYSNDEGSYKRNSMGRYSRGNGGSYRNGSYAGGSYERGYSREDAKDDLAMELRNIKSGTSDPEVSHMIDMWMDQLNRQ